MTRRRSRQDPVASGNELRVNGPAVEWLVTIKSSFARSCRLTRLNLDITQRDLAEAVGLSRGHIAKIEAGRANPTVDQIDRIGRALGMRLDLVATPPTFLSERRTHDLVHARCSGHLGRRLIGDGWLIAREVEVVEDGIHGWVDLLAFDPDTHTLLIIEIKTRLDDLGAIERQIGWYERLAPAIAAGRGWVPARQAAWLVLLASDEVDRSLVAGRDVIESAFPGRARDMVGALGRAAAPIRSLAMVDPTNRRRDWLIRTRLDGRRTAAPFRDYADAARRFQP